MDEPTFSRPDQHADKDSGLPERSTEQRDDVAPDVADGTGRFDVGAHLALDDNAALDDDYEPL